MMIRNLLSFTISLAFLTSGSAAKLVQTKDAPSFKVLAENDYSAFAKDIAKDYAQGELPEYNYIAPKLANGSMKSIEFYATDGCRGGGADATITITDTDLLGNHGTKSCASGPKGDHTYDDLEGNGSSFVIHGHIGRNCQFHFYKSKDCAVDDGNHLGFITAAQQTEGCMQLYDSAGKVVTGMSAVSYICDPDLL